jgi:hypothetical protein
VVWVKGILDALHDGCGLPAPLHLYKGCHVATSAMLSLQLAGRADGHDGMFHRIQVYLSAAQSASQHACSETSIATCHS